MTFNQEKKVGVLLEQTTRIAKLSFIKVFKKMGVKITPEQWAILEILYYENGLSQTELGEKAFKNKPTISRIIDNTCEKKLTRRRPFAGDRRKFQITLTAKGKKLVEKCAPKINELRGLSWKGLSNNDYKQFQRIISQLFGNFDSYK